MEFENQQSVLTITNEQFNKTIFSQDNMKNILFLSLKLSLALITTLLNAFIIFTFLFIFKKKTFSDLIFVSIAVSDFLIGSVTMSSQALVDYLSKWPFDKATCITSIFVQYALPDTTVLSLLILTIHRYFQLYAPFAVSEKINNENILVLFLSWTFSFALWFISIFYLISNGQWCATNCTLEPSVQFILVKVIVFGLIPLSFIIVLNFLLLYKLNKKRLSRKKMKMKTIVFRKSNLRTALVKRKRFDSFKSLKIFNKMKREKKAFFCILSLTVSIFVTQIIYLIGWPAYKIMVNSFVKVFYKTGVWMSYLTSLFNPVLVYLFHEKCKKEIRTYLSEFQCCNNSIKTGENV